MICLSGTGPKRAVSQMPSTAWDGPQNGPRRPSAEGNAARNLLESLHVAYNSLSARWKRMYTHVDTYAHTHTHTRGERARRAGLGTTDAKADRRIAHMLRRIGLVSAVHQTVTTLPASSADWHAVIDVFPARAAATRVGREGEAGRFRATGILLGRRQTYNVRGGDGPPAAGLRAMGCIHTIPPYGLDWLGCRIPSL